MPMTAPTTYDNVGDGVNLDGQLFAGKRFWVAQRVPHRSKLLDKIRNNGGKIALLEKLADWMIADHFRRDCPPGTISYEFVEKSVQQGRILDPEDFPAGPPLGSYSAVSRPAKSTRVAYTADEDKLLYNWVRDAEKAGRLVGGNEVYKELEEKFPRHTWQSWRDRYLKKLRDMPPSSFGSPESASSTPPAGEPAKNAPSTKPSSSIAKTPAIAKPERVASEVVATEEEYTVNQLAATFTPDDWEELYAIVDIIEKSKESDNAWKQLADSKDNQTAEQWRQYYEKIVRPQWMKDPVWKKEQIKKKFEEKHAEKNASQSHNVKDVEGVEDSENVGDVSTTLVAEHAEEASGALTTKELPLERSVAVSNKHLLQETTASLSDTKLMSSSTAHHESPKYITKLYETTRKRLREIGDTKELQRSTIVPRPAKRRKSTSMSPTLVEPAQQAAFVGTQQQPLEVSSTMTTSSSSQETVEEQLQHPMSDAVQAELQLQEDISRERDIDAPSESDDEDDVEIVTRSPQPAINEHVDEEVSESIESETEFPARPLPIPRPQEDLPENMYSDTELPSTHQPQLPVYGEVSSNLPSDSPTPRANRTKLADFDTRAIPSSPSQDLIPTEHPESDASTTQSLQEFRSLNKYNDSLPNTHIHRLPRPASPSPVPLSPARSTTSSTGSGDPDVPLDASELDEFYAEMHEQGFTNDFITKALKRTRLRPELAATVLDAWRKGLPLPDQRGVWSIEDDEAVESGDGVALALLQRKHSLDGWGGITERVGFLQTWRGR